MIFSETALSGAYVVDLERIGDERGFFARSFCQREFAALGLNARIAQANISFNLHRGTIRGMHFQYPPAGEAKIIRCTRGAMMDVIVDLRPESPTYLQHVSIELTAETRRCGVRAGALRARLPGSGAGHGDDVFRQRVLRAGR